VTANEVQNPDLFWALKGGGPASFAVILSVTMKTFPDIKASGAVLYINSTHTNNSDTWWTGVSTFHKWSNRVVDNGLYAYFEVLPQTFRVRPFVGIGKTSAQLKAILKPMLDELDNKHVPYEFSVKSFSTFYDLYIDLFEDEGAGSSALTGGWMFNHDDVANRNDQIINAFKTVMQPRADLIGFMVGHLFNPGYNMPVANSATHPAWRNATDFIISILPVPVGASLAQKADLQQVLTHTMDDALRGASHSGCTYVNEVRVQYPRLPSTAPTIASFISPPCKNTTGIHTISWLTVILQADPYQPNWQSHFWGSNYPRLKQIRKTWDPLGVFYAVSTPGTEDWEVIQDGTKLCKKL